MKSMGVSRRNYILMMGSSQRRSCCSSSSSSSWLVMLVLQLLVLMFQLVAFMGLQQGVEAQGSWEIVQNNAGIASMHTAVTNYGTVVLLDRTDIGPSQLPLPDGVCRNDPNDEVSIGKLKDSSFDARRIYSAHFHFCPGIPLLATSSLSVCLSVYSSIL